MNVRENLVKQLRWWSDKCDRTNFGCQARKLLVEAADYIAHGVTAQEWISVKDRLPDLIPCNVGTAYSEAVIAWTSGRKAMIAVWDGIDWIAPFDYWEAWGEEITHWMPLPEPPKGE